MTFSELMGAVVRTATSGVVAGSRRNALTALESRYQVTRESRDVMLALTAAVSPAAGPAGQRRSA
jgi:hypothetical protein